MLQAINNSGIICSNLPSLYYLARTSSFLAPCTVGGSCASGPQSGHRVGAVSESGALAGSSRMKQWRLGFDSVARVLLNLAAAARSLIWAELQSTEGFIGLSSSLQCSLLKAQWLETRPASRWSAMVQYHWRSHCFLGLRCTSTHSFEQCWDEGRFQSQSFRA